MVNKLDISSLKRAASAYEKALEFALKTESKSAEELDDFGLETAIASLIQHFEFTYELCWKTMKRYIEMDIGAEADILTRLDLFRQSAERQLIEDFERWVLFHKSRNKTAHMYDRAIAEDIYEIAKSFTNELNKFIKTMEQRI